MMKGANIPFDKGWNCIKSGFMDKIEQRLEDIQLANYQDKKLLKISPTEYITYYTLVYDMCTQQDSNCADLLYCKLGQTLSEYIEKKMCKELEANKNNDVVFQQLILTNWIKYKSYINIIKGIFAYLDRFHVPLALQPTIYEYGMGIFQKLVGCEYRCVEGEIPVISINAIPVTSSLSLKRAINDLFHSYSHYFQIFEPYKSSLKTTVLDALDDKRSGIEQDSSIDLLIKGIIEMYNLLDSTVGLQYKEQLEPFIIERASNYYSKIAPIWIKELSLTDYFHIIDHCVQEEELYCNSYLNGSSKDLLVNIVLTALLYNQKDALFNKFSELLTLFSNNEKRELKRVYKYVKNMTDGISNVIKYFKIAIKNRLSMVDVENKVEHLIRSFSHFKLMIDNCFSDEKVLDDIIDDNKEVITNPIIQKTLYEVFEKYLNDEEMARNLVECWHDLLLSNTVKDAELDNFVDVFNLISEKEGFLSYFRVKLSQRLLNEQCTDLDLERLCINKIKQKCGSQCTYKLDNMINDIKESIELNSQRNDNVNFYIVSDINWPTFKDDINDVRINPCFRDLLDEMEAQFKSVNKCKIIKWILQSCHVELSCLVKGAEKIIKCDVLQASVILLFNENKRLDVKNIIKELAIDIGMLELILKPLLDREESIFIINGEEIEINYEFSDYLDVTHQSHQAVKLKPTGKIDDKSAFDHTYLDALIVKILKEYKEIAQGQLLEIVTDRCRRNITNQMILERVCSLEDRDYVSRVEDRILYLP